MFGKMGLGVSGQNTRTYLVQHKYSPFSKARTVYQNFHPPSINRYLPGQNNDSHMMDDIRDQIQNNCRKVNGLIG